MKSLTIVTVTYNAASTIEPTLRSILSQTVFADQIEFILVDGGSTDGTLDIAHRLLEDRPLSNCKCSNCQILSEADHGIYDAMNKGARLATAPWILFMNAGDSLFASDTIESLHLDEASPDHIIYGDHITTHGDEKEQTCQAQPFWQQGPRLIAGLGICHQSIYMPTRWMQEHPFRWEQYRYCADFEAIHYWRSLGKSFTYISRPLCRFEQGDGFSSRPEVSLLLLDENARIVGRRHTLTYYKIWLRMWLNLH